MIRWVLFDWGGVLTEGEYDRQVARELAAQTGLPELDLYHAWRTGRRLALERGEAGLDEAWDELAAGFVLPGTADDFRALLIAAISPEAAVLDLLPPLRSRVSVALLSNNYPVVAAFVRKSVGAYFDRLFFSNETGLVKPDPAAFRDALDSMGAGAAETLFVDDKERNVVPARELGFQVHLYRDPVRLREDLVDRGLLVA